MTADTTIKLDQQRYSHDDQGHLSSETYPEELPDLKLAIKQKLRSSCGWPLILNRLPILKWLPLYQWNYLIDDFVAGLTVGLTAIPQSIAYAVVAGLSPQYGLYSAFMGCFVYIFFGSCKDVTIGPTAIMALMIQRYVSASPDYAILSCFLTGCIVTIFGILNLGFLVQFISSPVTAGFTTAAAITIGSGQVGPLLGLSNGKSNEFLVSWENLFTKIAETKLWDTVLGLTTLAGLLLLKQCSSFTDRYQLLGKYLSLSRNAVAVIVGTILAYSLDADGSNPFKLTGKVEAGFPPLQLPPFSTVLNNGTETVDFSGMISALGSSLFTIPFIAILEIIAIAKTFSKGKTVDATQEMLALGLCNLASSFVSSMPITGSFTRTAINNSSGVRTTLGGLVTGTLVLLALGFLVKTFYFIPKATLAAIIISAMLYMTEFRMAWQIWKTKRIDIVPFLVTLFACLFLGLEYGIIVGVGVNAILILYKTARPEIELTEVKVFGKEILLARPDQSLFYSSAEYLKYKIIKNVLKSDNQIKMVVINGDCVKFIDTTAGQNILSMCDDLKLLQCDVIFWNWKRSAIGVVWRLSSCMNKQFIVKSAPTLEDLLYDQENSNGLAVVYNT